MEYERVHGDIKITRSDIIVKNYKNAKPYLIQDFHNMCGYCGKQFEVIETKGEIEHFIPKKKFPQFEHDYKNLILSCSVCNNRKNDDWPTNDASQNITSDGKKGYIDPATDDFDIHIGKTTDGRIVGLTDVGKYMVERFDFANRPMKECFRAHELVALIDRLVKDNKIDGKLASLLLELKEIRHMLFVMGENH